MAKDIQYPEAIPQGSSPESFAPAAAAPALAGGTATSSAATDAAAADAVAQQHAKKKSKDSGGGSKGTLGMIGEILLPILAVASGGALGGLLAPEIGLTAGLGEAAGGALGGALEGGIAKHSVLGAVEGGLEGAIGGGALGGGVLDITGLGANALTAAGAAAPAAAGGGSALGGAASLGGGIGGGAGGGLASAIDPATAVLGGSPSLGAAAGTGAGGVASAASPALAPEFFGAPSNPVSNVLGAAGTTGAGAGTAGSTTLGSIGSFLTKNPQLLTSLLGGGASLLTGGGSQSFPESKQMKQLAGLEANFAEQAIPTEMTGNLPPGANALVQNALGDSVTRIKANYANLGLSGSSMEAQDIAAAGERASAETFQIASQITQQGLDAAGLGDSIYAQIAQLQMAKDRELVDAISGFSTAAGYGAGLSRVG